MSSISEMSMTQKELKEFLYQTIWSIWKSQDEDYEELYEYHRLARQYYEQEGMIHKAAAHERAEVLYFILDNIRYDYSFNFDICISQIRRYPERLKGFVLYVIHVGCDKMADASRFARLRYIFLEETLRLGLKMFAEDESCDSFLRACIYYYKYRYCNLLNRLDEAEQALQLALSLGGNRDFEDLCWELIRQLPRLYESELAMVHSLYDYIDVFEKFDEGVLA